MNDKLKNSFNAKLEITPSRDFDKVFFEKIKNEKHKFLKPFSQWLPWTLSAGITAMVIVISFTNNPFAPSHAFSHREYVQNVIEIQNSFDESVIGDYNGDMLDLTTEPTDEI